MSRFLGDDWLLPALDAKNHAWFSSGTLALQPRPIVDLLRSSRAVLMFSADLRMAEVRDPDVWWNRVDVFLIRS